MSERGEQKQDEDPGCSWGCSYPLILQNKAKGTRQMSPKKDSSDTNFKLMTLDS